MSIETSDLTPLIQVFDMVESVHFYRDLLGFAVAFASPEVETPEGRFSHFVRLEMGGAHLMLNTAYDSGERPPARDAQRWRGHRDTGLYITCSDVDALYERFLQRGVKIAPPSITPYGMKSMRVLDPDEYALYFQAPV